MMNWWVSKTACSKNMELFQSLKKKVLFQDIPRKTYQIQNSTYCLYVMLSNGDYRLSMWTLEAAWTFHWKVEVGLMDEGQFPGKKKCSLCCARCGSVGRGRVKFHSIGYFTIAWLETFFSMCDVRSQYWSHFWDLLQCEKAPQQHFATSLHSLRRKWATPLIEMPWTSCSRMKALDSCF